MDGIRAALQRQAEAAQRLADSKTELAGGNADVAGQKLDFAAKLNEGLQGIDQQVQLGDKLVDGIVSGQVTQFHEVAAQLKQADLSFKFTLAVRNKFIDAYREIMRMSV